MKKQNCDRWVIVLIHRPGLDSLPGKPAAWTEMRMKELFHYEEEAVCYCETNFGKSPTDRAGWRVERAENP